MPSPTPAAPRFAHLHVHTEYSLLDGACRIKDVVAACKKMDMPAVAITDHGNMFGAIEFYQAAREAGVKPILGCETYLAPGDRRDKEGGRRSAANGNPDSGKETAYHQLLLAQNLEGYRNLIKLASIGYVEGFYYKPRIDMSVLREHSAGLICTSTCLGGRIPQALVRRDMAAARAIAEEFLAIFGPDRFFIELQNHGLDEQRMLNPELAELAKRLGVGVVATNDVHYLSHDDVEAHDVLCCISTRAKVSEENRFKFDSDQFYLKSPQEMQAALPDWPEALDNTLRIAEMCEVEFDFNKRYAPVFRAPKGKTPEEYLRELVYKGAEFRYGKLNEELRERIDYELDVICSKGFAGYFLIVWDFVRFARENDIPASARGSGCSTVVGYCLGISTVDPLHYGLYFERFMDPERDEMPDMDIDLCQDRRQEVIDYVRNKYGHVAQIITFGRLKARAAIRDICRALDVPLSQADKIAKLVPEELKMTIAKALEREKELRDMVQSDATIRRVIELGQKLEGLARHASIHAAGVVVADQPLDTLVPLYKPADGKDVTTQFEGPTVERVGLLKMDFLGLRTLSQIHLCCKLIERNHGVRIDVDSLPLDDPNVYALLSRGETRGVFQFESGGMRDVLMKMRPNRITDLIAANALFRPGPMAYIDEYVARKHGRTQWSTPHPIMTEVLAETYGIMVYQEQVSRLVNRLGGVPLRRAFRLAKAISKKKESMINAERGPFLEGCAKQGLKPEVAEQIFADILKFGGYAFNKAHSTGYAVVAYQTAYLKTYYPCEFMASLLTYESGNTDKIAEYIDECKRIRQGDGSVGISIAPPDINESDEAFTVVYEDHSSARNAANGSAQPRGKIRFGLGAISGIGDRAVRAILAARRDGPLRDLYDFCERVDLSAVNRSALEALIKSGAFDRTGAMRRALMEVLDKAIELGAERQRDRRSGQLDMFGQLAAGERSAPPPIPSSEWTDAEMLAHEKQTLGFYITKHPLTQHEAAVRAFSTTTIAGLKKMSDGRTVEFGGLVSRVRGVPITQGRSAGKKLLVAVIEDFTSSVEVTVFPDQLGQAQDVLRGDAVVFVRGAVDRRREEPSVRVTEIIPIEDAQRRLARYIEVRLASDESAAAKLAALRDLCRRHVGNVELMLNIEGASNWEATVACGRVRVQPTEAFVSEACRLFGPDRVFCHGARDVYPVTRLLN